MDFVSLEPGIAESLTVEPLGARKLLTLAGTVILTKVVRGDGKNGSTHPCTPIFGPDRNNLFGLNQHGNTRNEECTLTSDGQDQILIQHEITDPGYPSGLVMEQLLTLQKGIFTLTMTHSNTGSVPVPVNAGEHCYFDAPRGFAGTKINEFDVTDMIRNNMAGVPLQLQPVNTISIPGKPSLILEQQGFTYAMLWVGENPEFRTKDENYICIEPVEDNPNSNFFGSDASLIQPGASRTAQFSLRIQ